MTSQLNVDTIVDKAGTGGTNIKVGNNATYVGEGGSKTQSLQQGLTKAWVSLNSGQSSFYDSFNMSSFGDDGTGTGTFNFTNNMNNANYATDSNIEFRHSGTGNNTRNSACIDRVTSNFEGMSGYTDSDGVFRYLDVQKDLAVNGDLA
ncbi:MAG: hypothetical protein DWQ28_06090 [Proteobacteria bacterium]|nr:MAG: hypothetical protein DWQ28_06090 [Pseudomonadota bacterium]